MSRLLAALLAVSLLSPAAHATDIAKPAVFQFGSSVADMEARMKPLCTSLNTRGITPITAPLAKHSQVQIDCLGFAYAGHPRKVELVFQDDQLDIVWVRFPEEERPQLLAAFKARHGEPSQDIDFGTVFLQANAALRNKPSEVLFASDRQVQTLLKMLKAAARPATKETP